MVCHADMPPAHVRTAAQVILVDWIAGLREEHKKELELLLKGLDPDEEKHQIKRPFSFHSVTPGAEPTPDESTKDLLSAVPDVDPLANAVAVQG